MTISGKLDWREQLIHCSEPAEYYKAGERNGSRKEAKNQNSERSKTQNGCNYPRRHKGFVGREG